MMKTKATSCVVLTLTLGVAACSDDQSPPTDTFDTTGDGDGDGDSDPGDGDGDGDGDPGDGDPGDGACGDGVIDDGEECDDGNMDNTDACVEGCVAQACGDGYVGPSEGCDDGNIVDDDECSNACAASSCGDGAVQMGEECDDANADNTDDCLDSCVAASCGDGYIQANVETCDDGNMDEADGCITTCITPTSCMNIVTELMAPPTSGVYVIDPDGPGMGEAEFEAYCDMDSDGGGWTLIGWSGNVAANPRGVPYPGLSVCPSLDCQRGSAVTPASLPALFDVSSEFAKARNSIIQASYTNLENYPTAGKYTYGDLSGLTPIYGVVNCGDNAGPFDTGTFNAITGSNAYDGITVYLSNALSYASSDFSSDNNNYTWNIGVGTAYCSGTGNAPGSWMGTWTACQHGPNIMGCLGGAHVVYVR